MERNGQKSKQRDCGGRFPKESQVLWPEIGGMDYGQAERTVAHETILSKAVGLLPRVVGPPNYVHEMIPHGHNDGRQQRERQGH